METTKEMYQHKMAAQLEEWGARIDALEARANKAEASAKRVLNEHASELAKLQDSAKETFEELKAAPAESWTEIKNTVEVKWSQLSSAMEEFWSKVS